LNDISRISWKIGPESMPAHCGFFKRADFGRSRNAIGCFVKDGYNAGFSTKGPHFAAPHNLPAKLLLRMRREDRAAALARMDQPQVLRQVFSRFSENALARTRPHNIDSLISRIFDRTRLPAGTTTAGDRAACTVVVPDRCNSNTHALGPGFYLRRAHEER
jgi:hypothetical protein